MVWRSLQTLPVPEGSASGRTDTRLQLDRRQAPEVAEVERAEAFGPRALRTGEQERVVDPGAGPTTGLRGLQGLQVFGTLRWYEREMREDVLTHDSSGLARVNARLDRQSGQCRIGLGGRVQPDNSLVVTSGHTTEHRQCSGVVGMSSLEGGNPAQQHAVGTLDELQRSLRSDALLRAHGLGQYEAPCLVDVKIPAIHDPMNHLNGHSHFSA